MLGMVGADGEEGRFLVGVELGVFKEAVDVQGVVGRAVGMEFDGDNSWGRGAGAMEDQRVRWCRELE